MSDPLQIESSDFRIFRCEWQLTVTVTCLHEAFNARLRSSSSLVEQMGPSRLPAPLTSGPSAAPASVSLRDQLAAIERQLIGDALTKHGGVVRRAAAELQMNAVTLARRARKLGLEPG